MMNMQLFTNEEAELVYEYLDKTYFSGYWENYERVYTICNYDSKLLIDGSEGDSEDCFDFFREKMRMSSVLFNDTNLVFMENNSGRAYYIGSAFFNATDGSTNGLFIELVDKIKYIQSGYPELLLDKRYFTQQLLKNYSIGKYLSDTLVIQTGTFPFSAIQRIPNNKSVEFNHFKEEGNQYLIYNFSEKSSLIIEWPSLRFLDIVVTFTYFFVGFFIMFFLSILSINPPGRFSLSRLDFRQKMQTAFIIILLGTMISIGGVVIFLSVGQYRGKHLENIKEKLSSVNIELEHKLSSELMLNSDWYAPGYPTLDDLLIKFSNVFYTDINLYDSDGHLLASSRREVFDKELAGTRMNYFALNALSKRGDSRYIHQEKIGELTFLSAYVPFYNSDNQLLAYLNLPYFNMQSKLTEEISNLVVAIVNFSLILLVISMGFAIYIAGRITSPLRMLREGLASVKLGEESNQLSYRGEDEIGELVKQYNIMLRELNQSAIKLARSEREDAWREMAKQIAHEIKNPLTPMKLNVQQLEKSWKDGSKEFEERLGRFTETQIEQIDNLSSIATEFSNFARMPKASPGKTNLVAVVKNAAELFSDIRNIDLKLETNSLDEVIIFADREQLNSMLTNLIRNGVQAIPAKRKGVIQIELKIESDKVLLSICDNGIGIPDELSEKLFAPNFTTKSSGMGLGLAIVKRIVETANGQVWFRSNSDIGTTFFVKYPIISFK
jgi:signal transduction histidine kinase